MRAQNSTKTVDNASQSVKLLVFRFVGKGGAAVRLSMNTRYAVIHASFWGAYGSLWAFIALVLEYNGFASAQVGVVTSCATLLSVFLSPAVSSFLDARPGLENRHGAMALLTLAAALCLLVWLVPLPRPYPARRGRESPLRISRSSAGRGYSRWPRRACGCRPRSWSGRSSRSRICGNSLCRRSPQTRRTRP